MEHHESPPECDQELAALEAELEMRGSRLYAAKTAYLNGTPLEGKTVTYDDLNSLAKAWIQTSYKIQKRKFGSVKVKISVAKLLRR
jgi:hypothetical protein